MRPCRNLSTRSARSARVVAPLGAQQRLSERPRGGQAADAGRTDEQVGMGNPAAAQGASQDQMGVLLADEIAKGHEGVDF
jgi:hypothetical protein